MDIKQKEEFTNEFIDRYFQRGFGSMNKNDFEVLIFDLLRRFGDLKGKSAHSVSLTLQIPESKVKNLAYEADLKYANRDERYVKLAYLVYRKNTSIWLAQKMIH